MHEIRYFLAVCDTLNFTRAAERCNVSQPALTRAIQKLEGELGGLLFARERHNTHLTPLGQLMQPRLTEVIEQTDAARNSAVRFLRLEDASMTLGVMCTIGPMRFVSFLEAFRSKHPGISLSLVEGMPARLAELLLEGRIDIALMAQPQPFDERLRAQPVYRERFVVAFAAGHPFEQKNGLAVADMDGQIYLSRINCEYRDHLAELCELNGAMLRRSYRSEREDWIQTMVAAGLGVCFMPEFSATLPGVLSRLVLDPPVERTVSLVTVAGRRHSQPVASFVRTAQSHPWAEGRASVAS